MVVSLMIHILTWYKVTSSVLNRRKDLIEGREEKQSKTTFLRKYFSMRFKYTRYYKTDSKCSYTERGVTSHFGGWGDWTACWRLVKKIIYSSKCPLSYTPPQTYASQFADVCPRRTIGQGRQKNRELESSIHDFDWIHLHDCDQIHSPTHILLLPYKTHQFIDAYRAPWSCCWCATSLAFVAAGQQLMTVGCFALPLRIVCFSSRKALTWLEANSLMAQS